MGRDRAAARPKALLEPGRLNRVVAAPAELNDRAEIGHVARLAEGGQSHHLVFIGGVQEAEIAGDLLVQQAERMRKVDLPESLQPVAAAHVIGGRGLLPASIQRQHRGMIERRGKKGAGGVRHVVLHEMPPVGTIRPRAPEACAQVVWRAAGEMPRGVDDGRQEERIPRGFPFGRRRVRAWLQGQRDGRLVAMAAEQEKGIVGVGDVIDVDEADPGFPQAVVDRVERQLVRGEGDGPLGVLDTREAFLLRCCDDPAILHQTGRGVVIDRVEAKDVHVLPPVRLPSKTRA
jgi:hypothetical protein